MMCKLEAKLPGIELNKCNGSTVFTNFVLLKWPFLDFSVTILNNFKKVRIFFPFIFFTINLALFLPRNLLFLVKSIYLISYVYNVFTNFFNTFIKYLFAFIYFISGENLVEDFSRVIEENKRLQSMLEEKDRRIHLLEFKVNQLMKDTLTISEENSRYQKENSTLVRALNTLTTTKDSSSSKPENSKENKKS